MYAAHYRDITHNIVYFIPSRFVYYYYNIIISARALANRSADGRTYGGRFIAYKKSVPIYNIHWMYVEKKNEQTDSKRQRCHLHPT